MTLWLWVFSILPVVSLAASSASVYLSPSPAFGSSVQAAEELPVSRAELLLTHHLGLEAALPLDSNDAWWGSVIEQAGGQGMLGQELMSNMNRDAVVVVVEADSEGFHGDNTVTNSFMNLRLILLQIYYPITSTYPPSDSTQTHRHSIRSSQLMRHAHLTPFLQFPLQQTRPPTSKGPWALGHSACMMLPRRLPLLRPSCQSSLLSQTSARVCEM